MLSTGLVSHCRLTPRCNWSWSTNWSTTLTTTVWVIAWVHYRTSNGRSPAHMALSTCLTDIYVLMVDVSYLTDCSHAVYRDLSHLA